jgi:hypothetical protein
MSILGIGNRGKGNKTCFSERVEEGTISVVKRDVKCFSCGHDKFFSKNKGLQCCRCRTWV